MYLNKKKQTAFLCAQWWENTIKDSLSEIKLEKLKYSSILHNIIVKEKEENNFQNFKNLLAKKIYEELKIDSDLHLDLNERGIVSQVALKCGISGLKYLDNIEMNIFTEKVYVKSKDFCFKQLLNKNKSVVL